MNVLLSFAQFEREVTGERIRDKVAASKQKGIGVGGVVPLGYRIESWKLLPDESEAALVLHLFERYLELPGLMPLVQELRESAVRTRQRRLSDGTSVGAIFFKRTALLHILRNRVYLGELNHRGRSYPGEHSSIEPTPLFDAVQRKLDGSKVATRQNGIATSALLVGKIYDDAGNRMTPISLLCLSRARRRRSQICRHGGADHRAGYRGHRSRATGDGRE